MAFEPLSTSNTFTHWITETQRSVSVLNQFTDGTVEPTNYSNTNISVGEDLTIGGNLTVGGFLVLDDIGYNDLTVAGNVEVVQTITTFGGVFENLDILNNVTTLNATSVSVGSDATVYGNLNAFLCCQNGLNLTGDLTANLVVIDTLTVNVLIGTANTNIYNNIFASNAYTSVQNTLAEFASLSCILG
jgi:hypothetical protein